MYAKVKIITDNKTKLSVNLALLCVVHFKVQCITETLCAHTTMHPFTVLIEATYVHLVFQSMLGYFSVFIIFIACVLESMNIALFHNKNHCVLKTLLAKE